MSTNPFINRATTPSEQVIPEEVVEPDPVIGAAGETRGPLSPLALRDNASTAHALHLAEDQRTVAIRLAGVHGGAGVTTLEALLGPEIASSSDRAWPKPHPWVPESAQGAVLLVARTSYAGSTALRAVLTAWHAGAYAEGLPLLGVCLVDDAPRLSQDQKADIKALTAMAPHGWHLPWQETLRYTAPTGAGVSARVNWMLSRIRSRAAKSSTPKKE